jgi:hypothetical protein
MDFNLDKFMISIREFFGMTLPGIAWEIILYPFFLRDIAPKVDLGVLYNDKILLYVVLAFLAYLIGFITIQIVWEILTIIGDIVDIIVVYLCRVKWIKSVVVIIMKKLRIFNTNLLDNELKELVNNLMETEQGMSPIITKLRKTESPHDLLDTIKLFLMEHTSSLGKEALKVEAELNFTAGMVFPLLTVGIYSLTAHLIVIGVILILLSVYLTLRFQRMRHWERKFVYIAFQALYLEPNKSISNKG